MIRYHIKAAQKRNRHDAHTRLIIMEINTKIFLLIFLSFVFGNVLSQQCGNCKTTPKLSAFGFDIQIPQPSAADGTEKLWPEWKNLFILAGSLASNIRNSEAGCIILTIPPSYDKEGDELLSVGGETFTNLPSNPNISSDLSVYGDYLLTGSLTKAGTGYMMHVEVQSSCSRKLVAKANVPFQLSSVAGNVSNIAQQAVSQLSPLIEKIKKFELQERQQRTDFALGGADRELIKLTPAKRKLLAGQETDVEVSLADCDGVPLPGRVISFTKGTVGDAPMPGTIGGIVTPSKVTTDASGKAKAKFKMTAGAGEPAIINAHNLTGTSLNCKDAFIGSAQIDALPAYKVTVSYIKTGSKKFNMDLDSKEDRVAFQGGDSSREEIAFSFSLLYYPTTAPKDGETILMAPRFEDHPEYQKAKKGKTVVLHNYGYYEYTSAGKEMELTKSPFGTPPEKAETKTDRKFSSAPLPPAGGFLFKNNELVFFSASVDFPTEEEGIEVGSSFSLNEKDEGFPVKPKKVTDPNSPYKWVYEFDYRKEDGYNKQGKVFKAGNKEMEGATVQIWKSF